EVFFIAYNISVIFLCILAYCYTKKTSNVEYLQFNLKDCNYLIVFSLLPFITIFGTYIFNNYNINCFLIFIILLISIIPIILNEKNINKNYFPYLVFLIALSLLLHRS